MRQRLDQSDQKVQNAFNHLTNTLQEKSEVGSKMTGVTAPVKKLKQLPVIQQVTGGMFNPYYKQGDFIQYAMKKEKQEIQLKQYVDSVIFQAVQSHLQSRKKIAENVKNIQKEEKKILQSLTYFVSVRQIQQFLDDPVKHFIINQVLNTTSPIRDLVKLFTQKCKQSRQYTVIGGQLIELSSLNMNRYIKTYDNQYVVPFKKHEGLFVKIYQNGQKQIYHQLGNNLYSKKQLQIFSNQEKQRIVGTVMQYLSERNLNIPQKQIENSVEVHFEDDQF